MAKAREIGAHIKIVCGVPGFSYPSGREFIYVDTYEDMYIYCMYLFT